MGVQEGRVSRVAVRMVVVVVVVMMMMMRREVR